MIGLLYFLAFAVEYFRKSAPKELGQIDMYLASDIGKYELIFKLTTLLSTLKVNKSCKAVVVTVAEMRTCRHVP